MFSLQGELCTVTSLLKIYMVTYRKLKVHPTLLVRIKIFSLKKKKLDGCTERSKYRGGQEDKY